VSVRGKEKEAGFPPLDRLPLLGYQTAMSVEI
jgi:hypothetical protein